MQRLQSLQLVCHLTWCSTLRTFWCTLVLISLARFAYLQRRG